MQPNTLMLIAACALLLLGLLHVFFGYKLARFVLPVCGLVFIEFVLYLFVYPHMGLNQLGTWLFFCGCGIAVCVILFIFPRVAAFFTGLFASALLSVLAAYALSLHGFLLLYPIVLTLCVLCGLLCAAYKRVGVAVFTSLFGGCTAAFVGLYLYTGGFDAPGALLVGNVLVPLEMFLVKSALLVGGAALVLTVVGLIVQLGLTAKTQVLEGRFEGRASANRNNVLDTL